MYIMTDAGWKLLGGFETSPSKMHPVEYPALMGTYRTVDGVDEMAELMARRRQFEADQQDERIEAHQDAMEQRAAHLAQPTGIKMADVDVVDEPTDLLMTAREQLFNRRIAPLTKGGFTPHVIMKGNKVYAGVGRWSDTYWDAVPMGFYQAANKAAELGATATPVV